MGRTGLLLFLGKQRFAPPGRKNDNDPAKGVSGRQAFPACRADAASEPDCLNKEQGQ